MSNQEAIKLLKLIYSYISDYAEFSQPENNKGFTSNQQFKEEVLAKFDQVLTFLKAEQELTCKICRMYETCPAKGELCNDFVPKEDSSLCIHTLPEMQTACADGLCPICMQEKIERLKEDLLEFGRHSEGCNYPYGKEYGCKCGWLEIEQALKGE